MLALLLCKECKHIWSQKSIALSCPKCASTRISLINQKGWMDEKAKAL